MTHRRRRIVIVGGGTAGSVLAARLSERPDFDVTLLEAGPNDDTYGPGVLDPAQASAAWTGETTPSVVTPMHTDAGDIAMLQGRILGGTSALNGMATVRGMPDDYDGWATLGLDGWGWEDVANTFISAERDLDFGSAPIHGSNGPLPVRRWRRDELSRAQHAYYDGMLEIGEPVVNDLNDPSQLPGLGVFPVTIDENRRRVTTSLAYLDPSVRARDNLTIRTNSEAATIEIADQRATAVRLVSGERIEADEIVITAGALWTPLLLMRSGVGPAAHLADHSIEVHADLPVGATMSDHLGPGILYRHAGARGGVGGPAQVLLVGASDGRNIDYHAFPIAPPPGDDDTVFTMAVFLLRSSGRGSVRLGDSPDAGPLVTAPPLPEKAHERLRHAFDRLSRWERSKAFRDLGCEPIVPHDLSAPDAVATALDRMMLSYGHMTSTCPMGPVLDADCRVHGVQGLRVSDASVMPTIPSGNTYLGCVMVAERVARKMRGAELEA